MKPSTYATICSILCGFANCITWTGYYASAFICESVLHSVNGREPQRIGAYDGFYGLTVLNAVYMLSTLAVPSLCNYLRCKWILALSGSFFTIYFLSFQILDRYLYFGSCVVLGLGFSFFNVGYSGYLTEFSTRKTIERNQSLSWAVSSCSVFGSGMVNFIVTKLIQDGAGPVTKYREYSDSEIRYFFLAFALLGGLATVLFSFLPNREVEDNIAATNVRCKSLKEHISIMMSVLVHKRVLILIPYYLYIGLFFSFWMSIIPTALQFTQVLSLNVYIPAYFGIAFTLGSAAMSMTTMKMSAVVRNFSFKPLMTILAIAHILTYALAVCMIPKWSTVRPNDEPSLLIQPSVFPVLVLAFLCGIGDAANNISRTVLSSLLLPTRRQQTIGASRFYHALSASVLFLASPSLSIYSYAIILTAFLIVATIAYFYSCDFVKKEEKKCADHPEKDNGNVEDRVELKTSAQNDAPSTTAMDSKNEKPSKDAN